MGIRMGTWGCDIGTGGKLVKGFCCGGRNSHCAHYSCYTSDKFDKEREISVNVFLDNQNLWLANPWLAKALFSTWEKGNDDDDDENEDDDAMAATQAHYEMKLWLNTFIKKDSISTSDIFSQQLVIDIFTVLRIQKLTNNKIKIIQ